MSLRIGVLGAGGFIGRHLVRHFAEAGCRVTAATREPLSWTGSAVEGIALPFESRADFDPLLETCDLVLHVASRTTPGSSEAQPQLEGNLRTTLALIEALQARPSVRLIYFSSGGTLYGDCEEPPSERAPLRPRSYHGAGKAAAEHFIQAWAAQFGGSAIILRPSNVYGPGQPPHAGFGLVAAALDHCRRGVPLSVWGDGSAVRDYLYIDDLVDLVDRVVAAPPFGEVEVFNVSRETGVSVDALLDAVDRTTGRPLVRNYQPGRRVDVHRIVPSGEKARRILEWSPRVALDEGLRRTWQWFTTQA